MDWVKCSFHLLNIQNVLFLFIFKGQLMLKKATKSWIIKAQEYIWLK